MKTHTQRGALSILVALLLPLLLAMMAMAIDMGYVLVQRNAMQAAADSAALLAANTRQHGGAIETATTMALQATQVNGFEHGVLGNQVSVAIPPGGTGGHASDPFFVRVTIEQPVRAWLAWIFGVFQVNTSATAIAGPAGNGNPCLLSLANNGPSTLSVTGNGIVAANACGIYINSNSPTAMQLNGNVTVTAQTIQVVGGYTQTGNVTVSSVTTDAPLKADPFAGLPMPPFTGCDFNAYTPKSAGTITLSPGTYCGGITISGSNAVTFNPGVYVIYGGGLDFSGNNSPVMGHGVTFINTGNGTTYPYVGLKLDGNVSLNLRAPLTGVYAGMLFTQDPLNTSPSTIVGNAGAVFAGNLYFPSNPLTLKGNSGVDISIGTVVAQKISVMGNSTFKMTNAYGATGGGGGQRMGLYE